MKILNVSEQTWNIKTENICFKNKAKKHPVFFRQPLVFYKIFERLNLFEFYCKNKKILHVGCTDYPIFDPKDNLHITLNKLTSDIHGLDLDTEGIRVLKQYVDKPYFSFFVEVTESYDVCLIPEVIEHVDNFSLFLKDIEKVDAKLFIITAPNAFAKRHIKRNFLKHNQLSIEINHPDHNCWFSPFTLKNVIEKYSRLRVQKIFLTNKQRMVCCICTK
jgi:hypothetical protein